MPELPEVETLVRRLGPRLRGRRILGFESAWPRALENFTPVQARRQLAGARLVEVGRRGKFFRLGTDRGLWLLGHLRMSGNLFLGLPGAPAPRFLRHRLLFEGGSELQFTDSRKFGRLRLTEDPASDLDALGPEPLERGWTSAVFWAALRRRRRQLKPLLLDQTFLAGLGNIYADESLHRARLHPLRNAATLKAEEVRRLHAAIRRTLREAIRACGSSFDFVYATLEGRPAGRFQDRLRVYGRAGEPCGSCGARRVVRILVAQRGTHLCPGCQPAPRKRSVSGRSRAGKVSRTRRSGSPGRRGPR
ncbi:MAG: bifunctional DNA-formamidopyrimidine glycosylase/DNA-(apurinic or apyrimidinic site) lyase [Planctomycetota bacterium]